MTADHQVDFLPESAVLSRWAACAAMMLNWRSHEQYEEEELVAHFRGTGIDPANNIDCEYLPEQLGMTVTRDLRATPDLWERSLSDGPIMIGSPRSVIVVAGLQGDGTPDDTRVHVLDPATGQDWQAYEEVQRLYELDPTAGYTHNLYQWP